MHEFAMAHCWLVFWIGMVAVLFMLILGDLFIDVLKSNNRLRTTRCLEYTVVEQTGAMNTYTFFESKIVKSLLDSGWTLHTYNQNPTSTQTTAIFTRPTA
jgi:hypothetical protein